MLRHSVCKCGSYNVINLDQEQNPLKNICCLCWIISCQVLQLMTTVVTQADTWTALAPMKIWKNKLLTNFFELKGNHTHTQKPDLEQTPHTVIPILLFNVTTKTIVHKMDGHSSWGCMYNNFLSKQCNNFIRLKHTLHVNIGKATSAGSCTPVCTLEYQQPALGVPTVWANLLDFPYCQQRPEVLFQLHQLRLQRTLKQVWSTLPWQYLVWFCSPSQVKEGTNNYVVCASEMWKPKHPYKSTCPPCEYWTSAGKSAFKKMLCK